MTGCGAALAARGQRRPRRLPRLLHADLPLFPRVLLPRLPCAHQVFRAEGELSFLLEVLARVYGAGNSWVFVGHNQGVSPQAAPSPTRDTEQPRLRALPPPEGAQARLGAAGTCGDAAAAASSPVLLPELEFLSRDQALSENVGLCRQP